MPRLDSGSRQDVKSWLSGWTMAEFAMLAALIVIGATGYFILELASEIGEGETHAFDQSILLFFRNPADLADPIGPWWFEQMMKDITSLGSTAVLTLITIGALGYLLIERKYHAALFLLAAIGGGTLLSTMLKMGFDRPRPDLVAHGAQVYSASFPSGHALMSAVAYLTLGALLARVQPRRRLKLYFLGVAIVLTLLIGISRVYLGVHWPTDVLAGWCLGAAWALSCWLIAIWLQSRGDIEGDEFGSAPQKQA
jgi:undecaprenyl-diphosphatase